MELALVNGPDGQADASELASLLRAASQGDEPAWRRLIEMYGRRLFALAKSRCRSREQAEEIVQSVFVTVSSKLGAGEYTEQGRFEAWLFRVTMNRLRDHARRVKRHAVSVEQERLTGVSAPQGADGVDLDALRRAIDQLGAADREIIELRHHGGMSFKQLAELLGEPLGTLLARHHRALRKLREIMENEQGRDRPARPGAPTARGGL
jgi:RNA polymerase sigma-70 factor (ECF subfamily)